MRRSAPASFPLAFRLARRELRGGVRGLLVVLLCLALGVAVIAAVGTLRSAVDAGLAASGREILGGDLSIEAGSQPLPDSLREWLHARGAQVSDVTEMRSILVAPSGERQLISLKAVDQAWPLVGTAGIAPAQPIATALGRPPGAPNGSYGLLAEPVVLERLGLHVGDAVRLGSTTFRVSGALTSEPDKVATATLLAPRVLISAAALPSTRLISPGSIVRHALRLTLGQPADAPRLANDIRAAFPDEGWRIRDPHDAAPGVGRFIDQTSLFLSLAGLTSLLVGGIGVANGVGAWLEARAGSIAILRCLGASSRLVFAVCLIQVMLLAGVGIAIGLVAGTALPLLAVELLRSVLPVPPVLGVYAEPLLLSGAFGVLTALCFALWPLGRAARLPGGVLFRDALLPQRIWPSRTLLAVNATVGLVLVFLTIASAPDRRFAAYFCLAALGTLALFRGSGWLMTRLAQAVSRATVRRAIPPWAKLGIASLHRPGSPAPLMLLSIGIGLTTLSAVALIEGNIRGEVLHQLPANAPSFFFVDIQSDQLRQFEKLVRAEPGVTELRDVPSLRARVVAVNGVPAEQVRTTPETAWALRGDRGLTYAATPPPGTRLTAGTWWPPDYKGPPLVSFDANLAKGWHVGIGDMIRVNVLGRDIDLRIANLRDIAWRSLSINFFMVASPGLLAQAPHTHIATVRIAQAQEGALLRVVTDALPNVTGILVRDVLAAVAALLDQVAAALTATGAVTLLTGILVLVSAVAAGRRRRIREAVILTTLGATRRQIRAAWLVEFGLLGLASGVLAGIVGTLASAAVMHYILHTTWVFLPGTLMLTLMGALATMLIFGYAGTASALRAKPAPMLRNE